MWCFVWWYLHNNTFFANCQCVVLDFYSKYYKNFVLKRGENVANIKIDLKAIAPQISEKLDEIRETADRLDKLARELYMQLGYDITAECETSDNTDYNT